jgi:hemoglobin
MRKPRCLPGMLVALVLLMSVPPPLPADENPAPAHPELLPVFEAFGGKPGLVALMDEFMRELLRNERTRAFFADVDHEQVRTGLVDQFCVILGGPCVYSARGMRETHADLAIDEAAFNALIESLQIAMDKRAIPFRAQNKLLRELAPMHREIITRP